MHYSPKHCPQCKHSVLEDTLTRIRFETTTLAVYRCQSCHHEVVQPQERGRTVKQTA